MSILSSFLDCNYKITENISKLLPQNNFNIFQLFEEKVFNIIDKMIKKKEEIIILDVGAGRNSSVDFYKKNKNNNIKVLALDISYYELLMNNKISNKVVSDVTHNIPLKNNSVDLIVSKTVLEHLNNVENFIEEQLRILKPEGLIVHVHPCRFSLFAIINRIFPNGFLLLYKIKFRKYIPSFKAYYDNCFPRAIKKLLIKYGYELTELILSFHSSNYCGFFIPLFFIYALYEYLLFKLTIENLSAYILWIARKPKLG